MGSNVDFSAEETKVLNYWQDIQAFETSLKQSEGKPIYTFYDGQTERTRSEQRQQQQRPPLPHGSQAKLACQPCLFNPSTNVRHSLFFLAAMRLVCVCVALLLRRCSGPPFATGLPHYGHILAGTIKDIVTRYAHQTGHHVVRRFGWDTHGLPVEFEIDQKLGIKSKDDVMKMGVAAYNAECRSIVQRYTKEWESTVLRMGRWIDFKVCKHTNMHTGRSNAILAWR